MAAWISPTELEGKMPSSWTPEQVQEEIDAALAWARMYVPCLDSLDERGVAAVNAVLRKAVPYSAAAASTPAGGVVNRVNAGPMSFSTETTAQRDSGGYFSPVQVKLLERLCGSRRSFRTIRTRPL